MPFTSRQRLRTRHASRRRRGATIVEYCFVLSLLSVVAIGGARTIGPMVSGKFNALGTSGSGAPSTGGSGDSKAGGGGNKGGGNKGGGNKGGGNKGGGNKGGGNKGGGKGKGK